MPRVGAGAAQQDDAEREHGERGQRADVDRLTVARDNDSSTAYTVGSLQYHGKGSPLPASLFTMTGTPRLVLISCGGSFDRSDDEYTDNVVVQAVPV